MVYAADVIPLKGNYRRRVLMATREKTCERWLSGWETNQAQQGVLGWTPCCFRQKAGSAGYGAAGVGLRNLSTLLLSTRDTPVSMKAGTGDDASDPQSRVRGLSG
jgi:hypothetical protein